MTEFTPEAARLARAARGKNTSSSFQDELLTLPEDRRVQAGAIGRSVPDRWMHMYFRTLRGEENLTTAVKMMCFHCVGWEQAEVYACTAKGCPLWSYRPKKDGEDVQQQVTK